MSTPPELFTTIMREAKWLKDHPQFEERPASMPEFLGERYLNIEKHVRPAVREVLIDLFGEETNPDRIAKYERGIFTGAIGIGKTTVASIVLPYMAHWVLCLRDPQGFFDLMPGSRIAFMQMSTSGPQAKEVVFGDIKARIENSPWFQAKYPYDKNFKNQIRFEKDIWILPGDSAETTFEGYNILGGILDEIDSHKVTKVKDYAEQGYTTIHGRITSRFQDRGFILLVGQMKKATGFAAKMYRDMKSDRHAYTCRMKIWESLGWGKFMKPDGTRDSFWYDTNRYAETTKAYAELMGFPESIIEVPSVYKRDFLNSPMKALRDLCGLPPAVSAPFIHDVGKVDDARQRWMDRYKLRVGPVDEHGKFADWFLAPDGLKRHLHIDVAYSGDGDALGLAMGHVAEMVQIEDEMRPFIVIDFVMRIKAPPGKELFLPDIRKIVYELRDQRRFRLVSVTTDGFESTEMRQQLQRKRFFTDKLSVDKTMLPYQDYYDALMDGRIAIPPYLTKFNWNDTDLTDIVRKESSELSEEGNKIDHPPDGSKDVTDCIAAVVNKLTGIRTYRTVNRMLEDADTGVTGGSQPRVSSSPAWFQHPAVDLNSRPSAPVSTLFGDPVPFAPPRRNK